MQAATGRSFEAELQRALRRQTIARSVRKSLGAALVAGCALIIAGVIGAFTLKVLDTSVGPFGAPFSVSDVGADQ